MTNTTHQPDQTYNGHPTWEHWNVALWVNGTEGLYRIAYDLAVKHGEKKAALYLAIVLDGRSTPDGVPYTLELIRHAIREIAD